MTTEKKLMNPVAKITGFEKAIGLPYTKVWKLLLLVIKQRKCITGRKRIR